MKSPKAARFKRMKPHAFRWPRASILSGTPTPNGYLDLWAQLYLLDGGDALGSNFYNFRDRFFDVNQYTHEVTLKDGAAAVIERKIAPRVLCLRAEDHLSLPPLVENDIPVELPEALRDKYAEMERDLLIRLEAGDVEINDALALSAKCRQFTSGAVYDEAGKVHPLHDLKLDAVADVIEEAAGEPVMVAYEFRSELARLLARWPKADWIGGGSKNPDATIARWNAGKSPLLLVQPQSVSHGLNLQHGPGRIQVWTSGTWVWDRYWQCVKRLHRQGQTRGVRVHRLYCPGTIDEDVLASLREKGGTQAGFLARLAGKVRTRQERSCAKLPSR
jgi:SNF2 family DNA or RNA helicase